MRKAISLVLFCALSLAGISCQRSPTGRRQLALTSDKQMEAMGEQAFAEIKGKESIDSDPGINNFAQCVARAVTNQIEPKRSWEVVVFDNKQVNAFALPGGKIGVYSGLFKAARTQGQLAAVLGHECGHVMAEHAKERVSELLVAQGGLAAASLILSRKDSPQHDLLIAALGLGAQVGILLPHSRTQESEADKIGLDLMATAGFDPHQAVDLWRNMEASGGAQPPEFLSGHPSHQKRIERLQKELPEALKLFSASSHRPECGAPPAI